MTLKKDGEKWLVDVRPAGRSGKRFRRKFDKKAEALAYEKHILATSHNKEWLGLPEDKRHLSELIELWWKKSGQFKRTSHDYMQRVQAICRELNNPQAHKITNNLISDWVLMRLEKGHKPATIRRLAKCLSNVFTVLIESGEYVGCNPMKGLKLPSVKQPEMTYLNKQQVIDLLDALEDNEELSNIVKVCLSTGSRWRETVTLKTSNLSPYKIRFTNTKTDKPRTVPISKDLYESIYPKDGRSDVFNSDPRYELYYVINKLGLNLPKGQKVHVLRHTFASHFVMGGGDILTLREILGHEDIKQTMTYAHLAPDHLSDAVKLNPLTIIKGK